MIVVDCDLFPCIVLPANMGPFRPGAGYAPAVDRSD